MTELYKDSVPLNSLNSNDNGANLGVFQSNDLVKTCRSIRLLISNED